MLVVGSSTTHAIPVASIDIFNSAGVLDGPIVVGEDVLFDGSGSYDTDEISGRYLTLWEWDLDNDGVFDLVGELVTFSFAVADDYIITLRVVNDKNEFDTTTRSLTVLPQSVPAPSTFAIMAMGVLGIGAARKLKKH